MKILKKVGIILLLVILIAVVTFGIYCYKNWTIHFRSRLDRFFGAGNWECVSTEGKDSIIYTQTYYDRFNGSHTEPGHYRNWTISFADQNGVESFCRISDHVARINHSSQFFLSSKRLSNRQALTLELMNISFSFIEKDLMEHFRALGLADRVAEHLRVRMSYKGGNPAPSFYTRLWNEPWFNIHDVSAAHYLAFNAHDFVIDISVNADLASKLSEEDLQTLLAGLDLVEKYLLDEYGAFASFEISFGDLYSATYIDGDLQE